MQCNCLEDVIKNVTKHMSVPDKAGAGAKVECAAVAIGLTNDLDMQQRIYIPFRVTGTNLGFRSQKGKEVPVYCTYCPFCGKPAVAAKEPTNA